MAHFESILRQHDHESTLYLRYQIQDERHPHCGAFVLPDNVIDTRNCGFLLAHLCVSYVNPASCHYHSKTVARALRSGVQYLRTHLRPGGCVDLTSCNFASAPDTAFTMNAVISAWWLLEKDTSEEVDWLREPLRGLIEACAEGVMNGGFHTPNHRWAISACLKHAATITGRKDFSDRADTYLGEGLDIDEYGEFAERSAGGYNVVNDDQMVRLYLSTGDRQYLEAAKANLLMMLNYIDPDGSVFTFNSTRQDYGKKVYLQGYYILFLLVGYLLNDPELAGWAEYCWDSCQGQGKLPDDIEWLLLYPGLEEFGQRVKPDLNRLRHVNAFYPASSIARMREGDFSCTVMSERPNFLYFTHGANTVYMSIYDDVCEVRNFIPKTFERIENGYRLTAHVDSWYYLPFDADRPETTDWWAMDNAQTRKKLIDDALDTVVEVTLAGDGVDVRIKTAGLTGVPARIELGFTPGSDMRGEGFLTKGMPGQQITVTGGSLQATDARYDVVTVSPCFAEHNKQYRLGGAFPLSEKHCTVWLTALTPFDRTIHIGTTPVFPLMIE